MCHVRPWLLDPRHTRGTGRLAVKILIVEDEPKTGDYLRQGLREAGFAVPEDRGEGPVPAQGH